MYLSYIDIQVIGTLSGQNFYLVVISQQWALINPNKYRGTTLSGPLLSRQITTHVTAASVQLNQQSWMSQVKSGHAHTPANA
jgi:hypothetical protein